MKAQGLEGLVAKRRDSRYEPGLRSGAWQKMRVNRGQEFVIGGYTRRHEDVRRAGLRLLRRGQVDLRGAHAQRVHAGVARAAVQEDSSGLEIDECPFANLPEAKSGRWGQGLTAAKMAECRWLKPVLVGQFEFLEWTGDNHLRHTKFVGAARGQEAEGRASRLARGPRIRIYPFKNGLR